MSLGRGFYFVCYVRDRNGVVRFIENPASVTFVEKVDTDIIVPFFFILSDHNLQIETRI